MTMLVVAAEVDLSVASVLGLSSALVGALWDGGMAIETIIPLVVLVGAVVRAGQRPARHPARAALAGRHDRHAGPLPGARVRGARRQGGRRVPAAATPRWRSDDVPGTSIPYPVALFVVLAVVVGVVLHATGVRPGAVRHRRAGAGRVLRRDPGQADQAAAVRGLRHGRAPSPASSSPSGTAAPAPTTASGSSSRSSPRCCSAASTSTAARARSAASSPGCCSSALLRNLLHARRRRRPRSSRSSPACCSSSRSSPAPSRHRAPRLHRGAQPAARRPPRPVPHPDRTLKGSR